MARAHGLLEKEMTEHGKLGIEEYVRDIAAAVKSQA